MVWNLHFKEISIICRVWKELKFLRFRRYSEKFFIFRYLDLDYEQDIYFEHQIFKYLKSPYSTDCIYNKFREFNLDDDSIITCKYQCEHELIFINFN